MNTEIKEAILDLAMDWILKAESYEFVAERDCGTGSDVPYALASMLREHASRIEKLTK